MLAVYLRVQLNILGGYMYQDTLNGCHGVVTIRLHFLPVPFAELLLQLCY